MEPYRIPIIIATLALIAICILAIAGLVIWDKLERRRFNREMEFNRKDYLAETMLENRRAK